ncbi:MAG: TIGR00341 family protein, partial [Bacteroidia bacterium]|nr:TIGR00341 family protein [Bacteroidia bacterium]
MNENNEETQRLGLGAQIYQFFSGIFSLGPVNYAQSIEDVKADVSFKGFNIWILICSILIASLGLNMNSTAVVIGAMLISPLMGPIVGLGLGIGIYDRKLIFKSIKNIGVASIISLATAFVFFKITPTEEVPELLARTRPTLLDLFVAFFGGIAGILAAAKCIKTNVVPGVAIATALMPPLCTAGFGLAVGNWDYFFNASYLYVMNCIMISVAAVIVVLVLRYPKFSYVDTYRRNKNRAGILIIVTIVSIPSIIFYSNLLNQNLQEDRIETFVEKEIASYPGIYITNQKVLKVGDTSILHLNINGQFLEKDDIKTLENKMVDYKVYNGKLEISQPQPVGFKEQRLASLKTDIISELYQNSALKLENKDDEIELLKSEIQKLSNSLNNSTIASNRLIALAKSQYNINQMAADILVYSQNGK